MIEHALRDLSDVARKTRTPVLVVGGAVRDHLLGVAARDLDLLVPGDPAPFLEEVARLAGREAAQVTAGGVTTWRTRVHGTSVDLSAFPEGGLPEALGRRDFTINAMAGPIESIETGRLSARDVVDPFGGLADLGNACVRHIRPEALDEDPLRLLRAVRLVATHEGFSLHPELHDEIRKRSVRAGAVAPERLYLELDRIMASGHAGAGLRLLGGLQMLFVLCPPLMPLDGMAQNRWHRYDGLEHTLRVVENADMLGGSAPEGLEAPADPGRAALAWAAVLHDTGKPATRSVGPDGQVRFHGHEMVSADIARQFLTALRAPGSRTEQVVLLVRHHLRPLLLATQPTVTDRALRRLIHETGPDTPLLCLLAVSDCRAAGNDHPARLERLNALIGRVARLLREERKTLIAPAPLLSGHDVMQVLNLQPGPRVGAILRWLLRLQAEGELTDRDGAIAWLRSLPPSKIPQR